MNRVFLSFSNAIFSTFQFAGFAEEDLRLVIVHDRKRQQDHAVLAARQDGHWLILDNRRLLMLEDAQLPDYVPLFVLNDAHVRSVIGVTSAIYGSTVPGSLGQ